jgi:hypothetical protein
MVLRYPEKDLIKDADNLEATGQHQVQSSAINMDQKIIWQ